MVFCMHCPCYVPDCYTPKCQERSIPQGGGYDHGGMCQIMSAARVLKVCSLCYSVVPTVWGGPPLTTQNWCIYTYILDISSLRILQGGNTGVAKRGRVRSPQEQAALGAHSCPTRLASFPKY